MRQTNEQIIDDKKSTSIEKAQLTKSNNHNIQGTADNIENKPKPWFVF